MILTDDACIEHLALRLIERSLPKAEWTHEAHFAAALWLLRHRPDLATPVGMRDLITGYNAATGTANTDSSGYHETITLASLRAAAHQAGRHPPATPLPMLLAALMASPFGRTDWLLAHWRRETLFGATARRCWVAPDLAPLPF